ncbi:odorant receptor 131-2-like [Hoplias malabaricus]|uniref:odorant receptor 131-2-like n=1 Tax=Hoplias malabaricus TaxID=27720 RepID=UPI0034631B3A
MAVSNGSSVEILFIHQQMYYVVLNEGPITKLVVAMLMSLFFVYVNSVMFYALRSKRFFKDMPRYILFAHMLLNDSIQLVSTSMLYCLSMISFQLFRPACGIMVLVSSTAFRNTPLILAVMSLERYVAICFPLRHAEIVTHKRTFLSIPIIWCICSANIIVDLIYGVLMDSNFVKSQVFCTRERLFIKPWQLDLFYGTDIVLFVSVTLVIVFTYIRIMATARSVSSSKESAKKAYRTVLLHLIQLCLCLTTFLYNIIERAAAMMGNSILFMDVRYVAFLFILVLPRCLSPLVYGLRDEALRPFFIYYFHCGKGKIKPAVNVQ